MKTGFFRPSKLTTRHFERPKGSLSVKLFVVDQNLLLKITKIFSNNAISSHSGRDIFFKTRQLFLGKIQRMTTSVGIIDYEMGNLRSVQKGIERTGNLATISSDPAELAKHSHLILPGVGAFRDAMLELERRNLVSFIKDWAASNKPLLGICLGMQLLMESSSEGGEHQGLGIIKGKVLRFEQPQQGPSIKIPHMGWNEITSTNPSDPMLSGMSNRPYVYFVHSYYVLPQDPADVWLQAEYGSMFCAGFKRNNVMATQFHPEKSQKEGLQLLANWCNLLSPL